ncbi:hypothetical protein DID75_01720 [Candidatus Marinamargulisbacteria bacterium SCGC AG-410-N11]|nr:hypothetical protein DID75_01720 [Candidatus Marinamargulisbacteria bacterium SCGC AG-410-N11]
MTPKDQLITLLKKKGTGASMSKHLSKDELNQLQELFLNKSLSITTKATLLTAILMLEKTTEEDQWVQELMKNPLQLIPKELLILLPSQSSSNPFIQIIKQVIQKKDLSYDACIEACQAIHDKSIPEFLKAAFLEAERLKRETTTENQVFFDFYLQKSIQTSLNTPILIDIANSYDGFNRTPSIMLFVAPCLAALGYPTILHGCYEVSPKKGITHHKLLKKANKNPLYTIDQVKEELENPSIGWSYIDQKIYNPEMDQLNTLRTNMVKRPVLATIEKFLTPFYSSQKTCLITGFTHPPYRQKTIDILNNHPHATHNIIIRGSEGSAQLPIDRRCPVISQDNTINEGYSSPNDFHIDTYNRLEPQPNITSEKIIKEALNAYHTQKGLYFDLIKYQCLHIITALKLEPLKSVSTRLNQLFSNKKIIQHWNNALKK